MPSNTLTITDNRTKEKYTIAIEDGAIRATDFRQIKNGQDDAGLMVYDPGLVNTASCRSRITYVDGENAKLEYRGYSVEDLAEHCGFLEAAYLLIYGDLPDEGQLKEWQREINKFLEKKILSLI